MATTHHAPLTDAIIDEIADTTLTDPRSVVRRLAGLPVRGRRAALIDAELVRRGLRAPDEAAA